MLTLPDAIVALLVPFATLFRAHLADTAADRRDPDPGPTHRGGGTARHGPQRPARLRPLPRGAQSGGVVVPPGSAILLVLLLQHLDGGDGPGSSASTRPWNGVAAPETVVPRWSRPGLDLPDTHVPGRNAHGTGAFDPLLPSRDAARTELRRGRWWAPAGGSHCVWTGRPRRSPARRARGGRQLRVILSVVSASLLAWYVTASKAPAP